MKTIEMNDGEFKALFELLEEIKTQEHDAQAYPRFWVPRSSRKGIGAEDDHSVIIVDSDVMELEDVAECYEEVWDVFLKDNDISESNEDYDFCSDYFNWKDFALDHIEHSYEAFVRYDDVDDVNPSFFKSDVKNFIEHNKHRLGENPHTYAHSIFRMDKMTKLMDAMSNLHDKMKCDQNKEIKLSSANKM